MNKIQNILTWLFKIEIPQNRVFGLDAMRAIAILLVMLVHGNHLLPNAIEQLLDPIIIDGVGLFFVLSGFLIGSILIKKMEDKISISSLFDFWKRRWFRTLPNYFLILTIVIILDYPKHDFIFYLKHFFSLQNFASPITEFFTESWSLSIEEWFYIFTPLIICGLNLLFHQKKDLKWIILVAIVLIFSFSFGVRVYKYFNLEMRKSFHTWDVLFKRQVITRLDSILFGVFGAWMKYYHIKIFNKYKSQFAIIGIIGLFLCHNLRFSYDPFMYVLYFSANGFFTLLILPYASSVKKIKYPALSNSITFVSLISYSMYLINLSIISWNIIPKLPSYQLWNGGLDYIIFWVLTILISVLLYKYFEIPTTKLRERKKLNK